MLKFATVLIFSLAIIQHLQIGDALTEEDRILLQNRIKRLDEKSKIFQKALDDTREILNATILEETKTVEDMCHVALSEITNHAVDTGKPGTPATLKCQKSAEQSLKVKSNKFYEKLNKIFVPGKEQSPRINRCKTLIVEIRKAVEKLAALRDGNGNYVKRTVDKEYNKIYHKIYHHEPKLTNPKSEDLEPAISTKIQKSYEILRKNIKKIVKEGIKCVNKA